MRKFLIAFVALAMLATPAHAWYRGYGYGPYYGGWGYGPNYGAALGIGAGAALLGGIIGGAIASQPQYYGGYGYYGAARCPAYDAWGNFIGYTVC